MKALVVVLRDSLCLLSSLMKEELKVWQPVLPKLGIYLEKVDQLHSIFL